MKNYGTQTLAERGHLVDTDRAYNKQNYITILIASQFYIYLRLW